MSDNDKLFGEIKMIEKLEIEEHLDSFHAKEVDSGRHVFTCFEEKDAKEIVERLNSPATKIKFHANGPNAFTDVELKFRNYYRCPECGSEWDDEWDSMCDDECGECGCSDISPYKSENVEDKLKSALKHITILQHDISYFLDENELLTIEVGDCEYDHILYMITEGYSEGELSKTDPEDDEKTIKGYWKIVK